MLLRMSRGTHTNSALADYVFLAVLVAFSLLANFAHSQPSSCDASIKLPSQDSPYSYRQRDDRCEGIYAREVAGDTLMVASFTQAFDDFTPSSGGHLHLSWDLRRPVPVRLSAFSLRPHFYYRMDSTRPPGVEAYDWPSDVLAALHVGKADLGVVATASLPVGGAAQDVYLPLRIGTPSAPAKARAVQFILVSDVELSEVYISVILLASDGRPPRTLRKNEPLGYGDYPAENGIPVTLNNLSGAGFYQVDVAATVASGGSTNLRFRFYQGET